MPDRCARCRGRVMEGEPYYESVDTTDLRRWHYGCADPDAVADGTLFLIRPYMEEE